MVSGPDVTSAVSEFEACQDSIKAKQSKGPNVHHREQVKSTQGSFQRQVESLVAVFENTGNPFK